MAAVVRDYTEKGLKRSEVICKLAKAANLTPDRVRGVLRETGEVSREDVMIFHGKTRIKLS